MSEPDALAQRLRTIRERWAHVAPYHVSAEQHDVWWLCDLVATLQQQVQARTTTTDEKTNTRAGGL